MRDDDRTHLAELTTLLRGRHVTTHELKGVLAALGAIARREPKLAGQMRLAEQVAQERIRRNARAPG